MWVLGVKNYVLMFPEQVLLSNEPSPPAPENSAYNSTLPTIVFNSKMEIRSAYYVDFMSGLEIMFADHLIECKYLLNENYVIEFLKNIKHLKIFSSSE